MVKSINTKVGKTAVLVFLGLSIMEGRKGMKKKMFFGALVALFLFAMSYAYFINQTVLNIVGRKNAEEQINVVNSKISQLELEYMERKNSITLEYAHSIGFKDSGKIIYVSKNQNSDGLTLHVETE